MFERIIQFFKNLGVRKPANQMRLIALPGAVLVFTQGGNIVLTPGAARKLASHLINYSRSAEGA